MSNKHGPLAKILGSVAVIALVATISVGATIAYFSGTRIRPARSPRRRSASIPTVSRSPSRTCCRVRRSHRRSGSRTPAPRRATCSSRCSATTRETGTNFCSRPAVLNIGIYDLDLSGYWYNGTNCDLYPGQGSSVIVKIGDDVAAGGWAHLQIELTLASSAGNAYQGGSNTDFVHLIAVQYNGPAPIANKQGSPSRIRRGVATRQLGRP